MTTSTGKSWKEEDWLGTVPELDPEDDDDLQNNKDLFYSKGQRAENEDLTTGHSQLRYKNITLPSTKSGRYAGKLSSRSKLQDAVQDSGDSDDLDDVDLDDLGDDGDAEDDDISLDGEDGDGSMDSESGLSEDEDEDVSDGDDDDEEEYGSSLGSSEEDDGKSDEDMDDGEEDGFRSQRKKKNLATSNEIESVSVSSASDDVNKGRAVQTQLGMWESLLEMRIRLQPVLLSANRMPSYLKMPSFCPDAEHKAAVGDAKVAVRQMLTSLVDLQHQLLEKSSELKPLAAIATTAASTASNQRTTASRLPQPCSADSDEEIDSDIASGDDEDEDGNDDMMQMFDKGKIDGSEQEEEDDAEDGSDGDGDNVQDTAESFGAKKKRKKAEKSQSLKSADDFEAVLAEFHLGFEPFRNQVLTKWSDRTRLGAGKLTVKSFKSGNTSIVNAIDQVLNDQDRLLKRTQLNRSNELPIGDVQPDVSKSAEATRDSHLKSFNPEIFDDGDFYHLMLKEFIEGRTRIKDANDSVAFGRQWVQIQKLRRKVKKQVDTKASKGRKIRYDVHPKLVNFTVPIPGLAVEDSARDGMLSLIFGKRRHRS